MSIKSVFKNFTLADYSIWIASMGIIISFFGLFDGKNFLSLAASLIGVTSLIFAAKGNPMGQLLIIIFSAIYGYISFGFSYYGEMITYLGMTAPMAVISLISWLRNPFHDNPAEVRVNTLQITEIILIPFMTATVTFVFFFILKYFHTANLIISTLSVSTSFAAAYLTFRRSAFFALAYAMNDAVLIVLWAMAVSRDISSLSVLICFVMFLINDIYGFISWLQMKKRQQQEGCHSI